MNQGEERLLFPHCRCMRMTTTCQADERHAAHRGFRPCGCFLCHRSSLLRVFEIADADRTASRQDIAQRRRRNAMDPLLSGEASSVTRESRTAVDALPQLGGGSRPLDAAQTVQIVFPALRDRRDNYAPDDDEERQQKQDDIGWQVSRLAARQVEDNSAHLHDDQADRGGHRGVCPASSPRAGCGDPAALCAATRSGVPLHPGAGR